MAILVNATNLPEIFKYPLMLLFGLGGFALAFVPFEGRSLDIWFLAFIKSIYKPTLFFWKKTNPVPEAFKYIQPKFIDLSPKVDYSGVRTQRAKEFLETMPGSSSSKTSDVPDEDVSSIMALFSQPITASVRPAYEASVPIYQQPVKEVVIKPAEVIKVEPQSLPQEEAPTESLPNMQAKEVTSSVKRLEGSVSPVATSASLPFPKPPTKPNMIVGMTFSSDEPPKIIDNAIVEIVRRSDGTPVRALKTNALGQFGIVTPLDSGEYEINVEQNGYSFDKTLLVLNNQVVQPLLIQAKK